MRERAKVSDYTWHRLPATTPGSDDPAYAAILMADGVGDGSFAAMLGAAEELGAEHGTSIDLVVFAPGHRETMRHLHRLYGYASMQGDDAKGYLTTYLGSEVDSSGLSMHLGSEVTADRPTLVGRHEGCLVIRRRGAPPTDRICDCCRD